MSESSSVSTTPSQEPDAFRMLEARFQSDWKAVAEFLFQENGELRALLDIFENYCEFRMGVRPYPGIAVKDIPKLADMNKARQLLGLKLIKVPDSASDSSPAKAVAP